MRFIFAPIGILAGLAAGFAAQKGFDRIWAAAFDEEEARTTLPGSPRPPAEGRD